MSKPYDFRNCSSLFGYAESVHRRSGGICQLCGCGKDDPVSFDLWRQFTVEHLIGESQYGYLKQIRTAVAERFPEMPVEEQLKLASKIDEANTVSACQFCNSTTSRVSQERSMRDLILQSNGSPEQVLSSIQQHLFGILEAKRRDVEWKIESVRAAFEERILPALTNAREQT